MQAWGFCVGVSQREGDGSEDCKAREPNCKPHAIRLIGSSGTLGVGSNVFIQDVAPPTLAPARDPDENVTLASSISCEQAQLKT